MDPLFMLLLLALAMGGWLWWRQRERPMPPETDTWELPPETDEASGAPAASPPPADRAVGVPPAGRAPAAPSAVLGPREQPLTREALTNRNRVLDPSRWDNSPDGAASDDDGATAPPTVFDRDALRKRSADQE